MILDKKDFLKWVKENKKEAYESMSFSSILYRTKRYFTRLISVDRFLLISGVCTIMKDLYKVEQDYLDNLDKDTNE